MLYMSGQHDDAAGLTPDDTLIAKPFTIDALVTAIGDARMGAAEGE